MARMTGLLTVILLPWLCLTAVLAQDEDEPTLEERVAALERGLASLETRFQVSPAAVPGAISSIDTTRNLASQLMDLQREVERLRGDIQRVERKADAAQREAAGAERDALNAERIARDAANRVR